MEVKSLVELPLNDEYTIVRVEGPNDFVCQMYELGVFPGEKIRVERHAPLSGPLHVRAAHFSFYLRRQEAMNIFCQK